MRSRAIVAALALAGAALSAGAAIALQPHRPARPRAVVPIARLRLPDGAIRYTLRLSIDDAPPIAAMFDTGSFGLRVLAGDAAPAGEERPYAFASGVRVAGPLVPRRYRLADGPGAETPVQHVTTIGCVEARPDCPASRLAGRDFRFGGNGMPGIGLPAILGASIAQPGAASMWGAPLAEVADRWIVELPRAADPAGALILNPSDAETAGFQMFAMDPANAGHAGRNAALPGCLSVAESGRRLCGMVVLDTGANGLRVLSPEVAERHRAQGDVTLTIGARTIAFTIGERPPLDTVTLVPQADGPTVIYAGALPYMFLRVLYDARDGRIGLAPRASPAA